MSAGARLQPLPPAMPQLPQNAGRQACAWFLRRCGWRIAGDFPDTAKLVLIAAPHSSWWDGVFGLLFKIALGADIAFMGKRELFRGPLGWALRRLGGIPIERAATHGVVEQMVERFHSSPKLWLGLAPEGTRKRVTNWKSGFWQIARAANVPILPVAFDYPSKTITLGPLFQPGADLAADLAALRSFYAPFRGKRRNVV
ncbi:1-acyl-sn-glycerol-3-phosphate acyltransferase [Dokdonella soli]|uniref:Lysophosphatidylcholine acyltransferase n=1 Tax=Dokdonella soli TaxID=529810 RepID=A0ABN1IEM7_9GAMM